MLLHQNFVTSQTSFRKTIECTLWDKMRVDLQIRVLLWLHPLDLHIISFICKYFHTLLSDPIFFINYDRHPSPIVLSMLLFTTSTFLCDGFMCFQGNLMTLHSKKYKLSVFNPIFPHKSKILTLPAPFGEGRNLYTTVTFDWKNGICKLIMWCSF